MFMVLILFYLFLTVICRFEGSNVPHGLVLNLGDLVEITQDCQGNHFVCSKLTSELSFKSTWLPTFKILVSFLFIFPFG